MRAVAIGLALFIAGCAPALPEDEDVIQVCSTAGDCTASPYDEHIDYYGFGYYDYMYEFDADPSRVRDEIHTHYNEWSYAQGWLDAQQDKPFDPEG